MPQVEIEGLKVSKSIYDLIENEIIPGLKIDSKRFWNQFASIIEDLTPINEKLIKKRESLQKQVDEWYRSDLGKNSSPAKMELFLKKIGYLVEEGSNFEINPPNVDDEIAKIAGPQLVVPVNNARYALNAANARWVSIYDSLYGSDIIEKTDDSLGFNSERGKKVIQFFNQHLNSVFPLESGKYDDILSFHLAGSELIIRTSLGETKLKNPNQFVGYQGNQSDLTCILLKQNGLHLEVQIDTNHPVGKLNSAGIKDVIVESAISAIQDCEDSVAAVDGEDKTIVYRNWLGLNKGTLSTNFTKNGKTLTRKLNTDRSYIAKNGEILNLKGRCLLLVRNVGHLMRNSAILDKNGDEVFEGIMDAMITSLCAMHDLQKSREKNSEKGSVYIVKPKMHGPEEVEFTETLFDRVEKALDLKPNTLKIGVMDEERRTTLNLKECIRKVKSRVVFINTGFLDRTGDEVHTAMKAGIMEVKDNMKNATWFQAYEDWNVDVGLACGFSGKAQIGKGMWTMPDLMKGMLEAKIGHLKAGANCAWVPSPTAASIHALHYHQIDVFEVQKSLKANRRAKLSQLLTIPKNTAELTPENIQKNLENNCQTILGYVVRWIDQGIGCSKVLDVNNIALMEDRATLRISSQLLANWLEHKVINEDQIFKALKKMAWVVDEQNANDANYIPMSPNFDGISFKAAFDLICKGCASPNGYTEPILHQKRLEKKQ